MEVGAHVISDKDSRIANARSQRPVPTVDQIRHILDTMPCASAVERRNRALIAFTLLTGARDGAIASLKLRHVDLAEDRLVQDAREVRTKFSKSYTTSFFPVGDDIRQIVADCTSLLYGPSAPLFPTTKVAVGSGRRFEAAGLSREHWSTATPIRLIFKDACTRAGLPYFNPHAFRKTLVQLGERLCSTPEEFKSWSQNLGHETVLTTLASYGEVSRERQIQIIRQLGAPRPSEPVVEAALHRLLQLLGEGTTGAASHQPNMPHRSGR